MTQELVLTYDVHSLPTTQHRAGLAGMLIVIDSLARRSVTLRPKYSLNNQGTVDVRFTMDSWQNLFDHLYAATTETVWVRYKRRSKTTGEVIEPLDQRERSEANPASGKTKPIVEYAYQDAVPAGTTLADMGMPPPWLKLWRDVVWRVLRAIPTTRGPYNARAQRQPVKDAGVLWKEVATDSIVELKGHLYLGAQEVTADGVPFLGRSRDNLLLHFWPVVMGLGVPVLLSIEQGRPKEELTGFVITVPDVHDLEGFCKDFSAATAQLDGQLHTFFKDRPRAALLAVPQEGALDYMSRVASIAKAKADGSSYALSIAGVEVYYLKTGGQQPRLESVARMTIGRDVLERYQAVSTARQTPAFRRQVVLNVLDRAPWHRSFNRVFDDLSDDFFIGSGQWFSVDADRMLRQQVQSSGGSMSTSTSAQSEFDLSKRLYEMVRSYVRRRTEERSGITWDSFKDNRSSTESGGTRVNTPAAYNEAQEKVCSDSFFALRACRSREDFTVYFTGTFCSVPQFLPEAEYHGIAEALLRQDDTWEDLKSLAMLAISALSRG